MSKSSPKSGYTRYNERALRWSTLVYPTGLGIYPTADLADISSMVHAFRLIICHELVEELNRTTLTVDMRR